MQAGLLCFHASSDMLSFRAFSRGENMDLFSRRLFMTRMMTGAGAALALAAFPDLAAAHEHAKHARETGGKLTCFTPSEAMELEAVCDRIIPSDDEGPGAREAGAIFFIDYVLTHHEPESQPKFRAALADFAKAAAPKAFSDLSVEQQIDILKKHEKTEGFEVIRAYTLYGFLGDPTYGGNRDEIGWKYIGFENPGMFSPPFGYYDAERLSGGKKEGE